MEEADLASLERQRSDVSNRIQRTNNEIAAIERKIERLNAVKKKVSSIKEVAKQLKDSASKNRVAKEVGLDWKGKNYDNYASYLDGEVKNDFRDYIDGGIDGCLDRIVDEITKYENEIISKRTILSGLWTSFNNLSGWIEKQVN